MKKMTCLSAIACVSWLSCNNEPENPKNKTTGENPVVPGGNTSMEIFSPGIHYENSDPTYYPSNFTYVPTPDPTPSKSTVEELRNKIQKFTHVDNNNLFEFIQTIKDFEQNIGAKVLVNAATIQDNKLTFEILGVQGTMDLSLTGNSSKRQKQFDSNISAIQYLNARGGKLVFPLNINTFPLKFNIMQDSFGSNLDKIKELNNNNHNKKFSVEKGVVKLDGNVFLKLDSLDDFQALAGALIDKRRHGFFDDTFKKNPITWKPNGEISFYGGEKNCVLFFENDFHNLSPLLDDLASMKKVGIEIDKIKIEQTIDNIELGGYPLNKDIWTNYMFWEDIRPYHELFDYGKGISIKEGYDGFITINNQPIQNVGSYKKYLNENHILKLEQAN